MSDSGVRRVRVVVNPISGPPRSRERVAKFIEALSGAGVEVDRVETEGPGHAADLARDAESEEVPALIVAGGDGTINEALNGLSCGSPTALGTLALGTSNILARDQKIPADPIRAARVVVAGRRRRFDVGVANGRRFLMVVGVGWDAHVVNAVAEARDGHLGKHRYIVPVAKAVLSYDFPELRVWVDDAKEPCDASLVFICNTRNYAAFFALTPDARPDDGLLDFLLVRKGRARDYLRWAAGALTGRLPTYRDVEYVQGKRIRIEADQGVPWEVDGDPGEVTPLVITLEAGAQELIVP